MTAPRPRSRSVATSPWFNHRAWYLEGVADDDRKIDVSTGDRTGSQLVEILVASDLDAQNCAVIVRRTPLRFCAARGHPISAPNYRYKAHGVAYEPIIPQSRVRAAGVECCSHNHPDLVALPGARARLSLHEAAHRVGAMKKAAARSDGRVRVRGYTTPRVRRPCGSGPSMETRTTILVQPHGRRRGSSHAVPSGGRFAESCLACVGHAPVACGT